MHAAPTDDIGTKRSHHAELCRSLEAWTTLDQTDSLAHGALKSQPPPDPPRGQPQTSVVCIRQIRKPCPEPARIQQIWNFSRVCCRQSTKILSYPMKNEITKEPSPRTITQNDHGSMLLFGIKQGVYESIFQKTCSRFQEIFRRNFSNFLALFQLYLSNLRTFCKRACA